MGIALSIVPTGRRDADIVQSESDRTSNMDITCEQVAEEHVETDNEEEARARAKEEDMEEFKKQLEIKREQRREILNRHRAEKEQLEKSLQSERVSKLELAECNQKLRELLIRHDIPIPEDMQIGKNTDIMDTVIRLTEDFEKMKMNNNKLRKDLADAYNCLQSANSDIADLHAQNNESMKQIQALKEVITVSKTMLNLRENQLNELRNKLNDIERTLADRETNLLSTDLRQEYERQLQNIRTLRVLYEERARLAEVTRQGLARDLDEQKILYEAELIKSKNLNDKVEELETKVDSLLEIIENKNNQIATCQDEASGLKAQMSVVNKLFSQVLLGYKSKQDLDTLVHRLEENHGLLTQMAGTQNDSEASSALPKLLLELVSQVDEHEENNNNNECSLQDSERGTAPNTTAEEIVENLPKVWKVLIELLSHQSVAENNPNDKVTTCYKSVETKSGPVLVPSVSQTYIRLKDLIIEKLGLVKEVNRMKQLNTHLESRLEEQERRLCLVTSELSKTWHVVGRLRRHHHQLHTHEKILKYELQQKRKLLNELKEELEYCREKWEQAREKHTQSEKDWKILRAEFSNRKAKLSSPSFNNSAESGYSDERPSDESSESNDESEYVAEPLVRCKKKLKKSFETILDSSTDHNQAAEREDPPSDMLDVADLPLDTQDGDENLESDISKSENFLKHEKLCEETEDECGEITHDDLSAEDISIETRSSKDEVIIMCNIDGSQNNVILLTSTSTSDTNSSTDQISVADYVTNVPLNDFNKSNEIETNCESVAFIQGVNGNTILSQTDNGSGISDHMDNISATSTYNTEQVAQNTLLCKSDSNGDRNQNHGGTETNTCSIDFKEILENVRRQNERLAKKDEKLEILETACSSVVNNMSETIKSGDQLLLKLDVLHSKYSENDNIKNSEDLNNDDVKSDIDITNAASTSNEIDHEARFAARDLRLKRLEEQTKSLVNKVNKTTSKGVKINYKLEELHNIYGSENSRASTPSEENNDKSKDDEPNSD